MTTRVALVEDHSLFAESLEIALRQDGLDARRVITPGADDREVRSTPGLLRAVRRVAPHVVLLDLALGPYGNGLPLIRPLVSDGTPVVVVTSTLDRVRWGECLRHGARKVVAKTAPLGDIVGSIRRIADGRPVMTPQQRDELIACWRREATTVREMRQRLERLTPREAQVLRELMAGHQVGEIARTWFVSETTVRTQVKAILTKLEVRSQLAAVGLAHRAGWQPPDAAEVANHQAW
jgi:DNA-binding NarL/FixJ family response regulator